MGDLPPPPDWGCRGQQAYVVAGLIGNKIGLTKPGNMNVVVPMFVES